MESKESTDSAGETWQPPSNTMSGKSTSLHEETLSVDNLSVNDKNLPPKAKSWGPSETESPSVKLKSVVEDQNSIKNSSVSVNTESQNKSAKTNDASLDTSKSNEETGVQPNPGVDNQNILCEDAGGTGEVGSNSENSFNVSKKTVSGDEDSESKTRCSNESDRVNTQVYENNSDDLQQKGKDHNEEQSEEAVSGDGDSKSKTKSSNGSDREKIQVDEEQSDVYSNDLWQKGKDHDDKQLELMAQKHEDFTDNTNRNFSGGARKKQGFVDHTHNVRGGAAERMGNVQRRGRRGGNRGRGSEASNRNEEREVTTDSKKSESSETKKEEVDYSNDTRDMFEFFWKSYSPFSQWHRSKFYVDDILFETAEQYMMYQKAVLFGDDDIAKRILKTKDPREQKNLGRKVRNFNGDVWNEHRVAVVENGNRAKFSNNMDLKNALYGTCGKILVEASPLDTIWGIGLAEDDPMAWSRATWQGLNLLGYALTKVRDEMMKKDGLMET